MTVTNALIQAAFSYLATVAFAICINVPRRALNACGIGGMVGWMCYWLFSNLGTGRMVGNLLGAFMIGIFGILFSRMKKMPVIIFNIPGLVPLVPGATAYQAVRATVLGNYVEAMGYAISVIMTAGAIAIGFMLAQVVGDLTRRIWMREERVK